MCGVSDHGPFVCTSHSDIAVPPAFVVQSQLEIETFMACGPPSEPQAPVGSPALGKARGGGHPGPEFGAASEQLRLGPEPPHGDFKGFGTFPLAAPAVHNLGERSKVKRRFTEVRLSLTESDIADCAHRSQKRGLAGAVLADEEGERRQGARCDARGSNGNRAASIRGVPRSSWPSPGHPLSGQRYTSPMGSTRSGLAVKWRKRPDRFPVLGATGLQRRRAQHLQGA